MINPTPEYQQRVKRTEAHYDTVAARTLEEVLDDNGKPKPALLKRLRQAACKLQEEEKDEGQTDTE